MQGPQKPVELFCSYAHEDEVQLQKLEIHLSLLKRQGLISTWYDRQIAAGTEWARAIDTHLNSASVILLLISPDFIASDYCYGVEMTRALERHQTNEARVIPILLRPVDWKEAPFAHLQTLPTNAKPVTSWGDWDEAFADVTAGIRRAINDLTSSSSSDTHHKKPAKEPKDVGKYHVEHHETVQGQVIGDYNKVELHFHSTEDKATLSTKKLEQPWNVPYQHNNYFVGREEILEQLHARFQTDHAAALSQRHAISGLGGIVRREVT